MVIFFSGRNPPDVLSAGALSNTGVQVVFSEPVTTVTAQQVSHYFLYPVLDIYSADLQTGGTRVNLVSDPQEAGVSYRITVTDVQDYEGNTVEGNNSATFLGSP